MLGRFGDASLNHFRIFKFRSLGGDEAKHNLLIAGNLSQWREVTGTVVVELQIVASTFSSPNSLAATGA